MVYEIDMGGVDSGKGTFPEIELRGNLRIKTF